MKTDTQTHMRIHTYRHTHRYIDTDTHRYSHADTQTHTDTHRDNYEPFDANRTLVLVQQIHISAKLAYSGEDKISGDERREAVIREDKRL